jgi:DNA polymerase-1
MYGIPIAEVTKDMRNIGKRLRHASNYSAGPAVVARALGIKMGEAKKLLDLYHSMCPMLKIWHKKIQEQLQKNRTLETPLGRKHVFMDRWGDTLFRSAYAFIPQSTVGDLLNISLVDFYHAWKHTAMQIWLQLHDAMYITIPEDDDEKVWMKRMLESMLRELEIDYEKFIIDVDFKLGTNWGSYNDNEKFGPINLGGLKEIDYVGG